MRTKIFTHIALLVNTRDTTTPLRGEALRHLPAIENAYLVVEDGMIAGFGKMEDCPWEASACIPVRGQFVMPCWCDSHTHLVHAGSREQEFVDKLKGATYAEIAARGGGILHSARAIAATSEDELFRQSYQRLEEVSRLGTGSIEIKSGYGLDVQEELKMLRVIKRLKEKSNLSIKATFLGAHAYPPAFRNDHETYLASLTTEMLPVIAAEKLADFVDVFCETGFFSPEEMERVCLAARRYGLVPKLHVNQLNSIGGVEKGIALEARSLDHLETLTDDEIRMLGAYPGCATLLPTAAFFLRMPYPPARALIHAGAAVALASDYNPGSSPSGNMNLVVSMSCIQLRMLPEEAINAATLNGAWAMGLEKETGSVAQGKKADLIFTRPIPALAYMAYSFGSPQVDRVMIAGEFIS